MTENKAFTVAEAIVEELVAAKVEAVYGIVSIHNMPIIDAIYREGSIRIVTARGESGAVNMADAYARATGKMGVVITSTGTGAGNTAGSLAETWNSSTPLLHITGEADSTTIGLDKRYIHEAKDQQKMMEGVSKSSYLLKDPKQITPLMRKAIEETTTVPCGPVTISVPTNFQPQIIPETHIVNLSANDAKEATIQLPSDVLALITQAKRPVIWAGHGVVKAEGAEPLRQLMERLKAPVLTSESAKGIVDESHPLCIGNFVATPQVKELVSKADLLLSVGVRFRGDQTFNWEMDIPKNHIHIDLNIEAANRNFDSLYTLLGDAKAVLSAINEALATEDIVVDEAYVKEAEAVREAIQQDLRASIGPYGKVADIMNKHLSKDTVLLTDVTIPGYTWGNKLVEVHEPRNYAYVAGGGIGQGLPMAIGAKIGQPDKDVVLIAGDGGFMVNAGEMITAIEEQAPVKVLLFDDGGYGILRYYQEAAYGRKTAVDLKNPDFVGMARSMGFEAEKVRSVNEFEEGLERALNSDQPYMVVVDVNAIGVLEYEDSPEYIQSFHPRK